MKPPARFFRVAVLDPILVDSSKGGRRSFYQYLAATRGGREARGHIHRILECREVQVRVLTDRPDERRAARNANPNLDRLS